MTINSEPAGQEALAHRFHFSKEGVATCSCGRWVLAKIPMTAMRAQRLARKYGKNRFGPRADDILKHGVPFVDLTKEQAVKDWAHHVKRAEGSVNNGVSMRTERGTEQQKQLVAA